MLQTYIILPFQYTVYRYYIFPCNTAKEYFSIGTTSTTSPNMSHALSRNAADILMVSAPCCRNTVGMLRWVIYIYSIWVIHHSLCTIMYHSHM